MKITRNQIFQIIKEYKKGVLPKSHIDGHPWSGTPEDLADAQGKTWGGGKVVDPPGFKKMVDAGVAYTKGNAKSPLQTMGKINEISGNKMKITKKMIKNLLEELNEEMAQVEVPLMRAPIESDAAPEIPGVETREDAWAGGDNLVDGEDWEALSGISNKKEQEVMKITEAKLREMIRKTIVNGMNK